MWKSMAQALGLNIPDQQLETISPVLDSLWSETRRTLDRDLSSIDPVLTFRPDIGVSQ
jgi:hypothetical protein